MWLASMKTPHLRLLGGPSLRAPLFSMRRVGASMTTIDTLLARVPVDQITEQAREVKFRRTMLTLLAGLFWLIGWTAGKVLGGIWLGLVWSATAVRVGWADARASATTTPKS